jgi:hypothetical protein
VNILITAATTAQAYKLKNQLNSDTVVLGDYLDLPDFMLKPGKMVRLPNPQSASYTHEMLTLCLDLGVEIVYLFRELEVELLLKAETLFNEYNIKILPEVNEI